MKTMNQPELSVIIPVYNAEATLLRCVDSVLQQSFTDIEILLVDDGSTDGSALLCEQLAERENRIRCLHQRNEGVSSARNQGLNHAIGKWVTFVDSDDWFEKEYLSELMSCNDECSLVVSGFKRFGDKKDEIKPSSCLVNIKEDLHVLWGKPLDKFIFWYVWSKIFRLDIIREHGISFHENMRYSEDCCFVLEYMSYVDNFVFVPSSGYMHLFEKERSQKYKMSFKVFKEHVNQQEQSFLQLENKTGHRYSLVRQNVHRRFFDCFVYHLLNLSTHASYYAEINQLKELDIYQELLDEVSYSFNRRLLRLALFRMPSCFGYLFRHLFLRVAYH